MQCREIVAVNYCFKWNDEFCFVTHKPIYLQAQWNYLINKCARHVIWKHTGVNSTRRPALVLFSFSLNENLILLKDPVQIRWCEDSSNSSRPPSKDLVILQQCPECYLFPAVMPRTRWSGRGGGSQWIWWSSGMWPCILPFVNGKSQTLP